MNFKFYNIVTHFYNLLSTHSNISPHFTSTVGVMKKPWAKALGPQNTYAVVTILALLFTLPVVGLIDMQNFQSVYKQVMAMGTGTDVIKYTIMSGLAFYMYNEASFLALERLSPVTHSVANTLKRVFIIIASCVVFQTPMSTLGAIGSGVAVLVS